VILWNKGMASRRAEGFNRCVPLLFVAIGLAACGDPAVSNAPPVVQDPPVATPSLQPSPNPAIPPGLTPLATPQQVVASMEVGRADPFAPTQTAGLATTIGPDGKPVSGPAGSGLPEGLRLTGVIRSAGQAQAFVQIGDQSGPLCQGPRGRCAGASAGQPLLPSGWIVTGIDAEQARLALSNGRLRQVISVAP